MSTHPLLGLARSWAGDHQGALRDLHTAVNLSTESERGRAVAILSHVEARAGDRQNAERHFREALAALESSTKGAAASYNVRDAYEIAMAAVSLRHTDIALDVLERTQPRGPWLWSYLVFEAFDPIRDNPRFRKIIDESRPPGASDPRS
jgi:hypothetical protein